MSCYICRRHTNAVLVHQSDEVSFREKTGFRRLTFSQLTYRRIEFFPFLEIWYEMSSPFIVRIYFQVVPLQNHQAL